MSLMLTGAILPILASAANIQLGETREYGDWIAGCDNALSCEAVALMPQENFGHFESLTLQRSRVGGPAIDGAPLSIKLNGLKTDTDRYRIVIDGFVMDTGAINQENHAIEVTSRDAVRLARGIAAGKKMQVQDGDGRLMASFSLKGSAATLRYMDDKLGLTGSRDAIVMRGRKNARVFVPDVPVISAKRINENGRIPETGELVALTEETHCAQNRYGVTEDRAYALGEYSGIDKALILVSCGSGAYNFRSAAYLATSKDGATWQLSSAPFDVKPRASGISSNIPTLLNADWDPSRQTLASFAKTRGLGDCGDTAAYVWDGEMFRLSGAASMPACRGSQDWITVWRTKVDFTS